MGISIEQFRSMIGTYDNFLKTKDASYRFKDCFWNIMLMMFYLSVFYLPTLKQVVDSYCFIGHFQKYHNTLCLSSKFCINIVSIFSWDLQWSQEEIQTMLMQSFGGQTKSIMVFLKVAYCCILIVQQ